MFAEQIIEFELRGRGPPGRTCTPRTGDFHDKTKISKKNLRLNYHVLLNILQKAMHLASLSPEPRQLQNLSKKCLGLNVNCEQKEDCAI